MEATTGNRYLSFNAVGDPYWRQEVMYDRGYGKVYGNFYYLGCDWKLLWKYNNLEGDTVEERPEEVTVQTRLLEGEEEGSTFGASIGFAGKGFSLNMGGEKYDKTWTESELTRTTKTQYFFKAQPGTIRWEYQLVHRFKIETISYYEEKCVQYNTSTNGHEPVSCSNEFDIESEEFWGITGTTEEDGLRGDGTATILDEDRGSRMPIEPRISNLSLSDRVRWNIGLNLKKCARTDRYDPEK